MAVALADGLCTIYGAHVAAFNQRTLVTSETHGAAHVGDVLLVFHEIYDVVRRLRVHFRTVGIGVAEHVAGELYDHHLHAEAYTEGRLVVFAAILCGEEFAFRAALSEARANDNAVHGVDFFAYVLARQFLAIDKVCLHFVVVVSTCLRERFEYALIGILQVVFSDEADVDYFGGTVTTVEEGAPGAESRSFAYGHVEFAQDGSVEPLFLHAERYFVDSGLVETLYDSFRSHVAEIGDFLFQTGAEIVFRAQHEYIGLYAEALQFLDRVLRRLGFQFPGSSQIGYIGKMYADSAVAQFPFELADGLEEGQAFDVAYGTADFSDNKIVMVALAKIEHVAFDLVGDMRNDLYGLAQIIATLLFDDALVDASRGDIVVARGLYAGEALVVSEVKVGLLSVVGDITFAVLVGVERTGVDVDVGVELLNGYVITAGLEELSEGGCDASRHEDVLCIYHYVEYFGGC